MAAGGTDGLEVGSLLFPSLLEFDNPIRGNLLVITVKTNIEWSRFHLQAGLPAYLAEI